MDQWIKYLNIRFTFKDPFRTKYAVRNIFRCRLLLSLEMILMHCIVWQFTWNKCITSGAECLTYTITLRHFRGKQSRKWGAAPFCTCLRDVVMRLVFVSFSLSAPFSWSFCFVPFYVIRCCNEMITFIALAVSKEMYFRKKKTLNWVCRIGWINQKAKQQWPPLSFRSHITSSSTRTGCCDTLFLCIGISNER